MTKEVLEELLLMPERTLREARTSVVLRCILFLRMAEMQRGEDEKKTAKGEPL